MIAEPVAVRAVVDDLASLAVQRQQQRRVVAAVVVVATTLFALVVDEVQRWQPGVAVGMRLGHELDRVLTVERGGPADRAGVRGGTPLLAIDDVTIAAHGPALRAALAHRVVIARDGTVYARPVPTTTTPTTTPTTPTPTPTLTVQQPGRTTVVPVVGEVEHVRDPRLPWRALPALPPILVLTLVAALLAGYARRRDDDREALRRLRHRSIVWSAVAVTVVVPAWLHLVVLTLFNGHGLLVLVETAVAITTPAWAALVLTAAAAAGRRSDGDLDTKTPLWPFGIAVVPALLFFVVPGVIVAVTGLGLLRLLERLQRRIVATGS